MLGIAFIASFSSAMTHSVIPPAGEHTHDLLVVTRIE
jgi:hypothetical protein